MNGIKKFVLALSIVLLVACSQEAPSKDWNQAEAGLPAKTTLLTTVKDCEIYRVTYFIPEESNPAKGAYDSFKMAKCTPPTTGSVSYQVNCGKNCKRTISTVSGYKSEEEILAEKKSVAEAKLTDEDKALLGLK